MKVVAIVQARMGSHRLPGKVLIPVQGKTVLEHVIDRVRCVKRADEIVIATSVRKENDAIENKAQQIGVPCYRGSEEDVLDRFAKVALLYRADHIVRITADCALLDPKVADNIIDLHLRKGYDYTSNVLKRTFPRGIVAEVVTRETLEKVAALAVDAYHREHVTTYIRDHPEQFTVGNLEAPPGTFDPEWRWVLDTEEDLDFIKKVYSLAVGDKTVFGCEEVLRLVRERVDFQETVTR